MANIIKIDNAVLKRQKQKEKKEKSKKKMTCRILVVCEGEKTEPNYFKKFNINGGTIVYDVECDGEGKNTLDVVNAAIEKKLKAEESIPYDCVWAVFDKDDFPSHNFNAAIEKAKAHDVRVAWSNEAFELWYLYHFQNRVTAMSRSDYKAAISKAVNGSGKWKGKKPYKYDKGSELNYSIMNTYGNVNNAIKWAKAQHQTFIGTKYANYNPCTTVYELVIQLLNKDEELIRAVMEKINE